MDLPLPVVCYGNQDTGTSCGRVVISSCLGVDMSDKLPNGKRTLIIVLLFFAAYFVYHFNEASNDFDRGYVLMEGGKYQEAADIFKNLKSNSTNLGYRIL